MAASTEALSHRKSVVQKQAGTAMSKWLSERNITSPLLSELNRNARECGWHRPLVSHHWLFNEKATCVATG